MSASPGTGPVLDVDLAVAGRLEAAFVVPAGSVVAVIGPNGAGKSSLVSALAGLVPARGHARLDGTDRPDGTGGRVDLLRLPVRERRVGVVFQDQRLFPHLSARENVAFGPRSRGASRAAARDAATAWLERVGLAGLAERRPGQLSGGQAQRVAIARALATDPALLLLDEPMAGLDVGVAATLRLELGRHLASFPGTTLLVTHDALDALTLADWVLVVDDGRLAQVGAPAEVAARPRTDHVARLVGLNVLRDPEHPGRLRAFSPTAVTVSADGPAPPDSSARHRWHGTVRSAVPHGDAVRLLVVADPASPEGAEIIADLTPDALRELALAPGSPVWLAVKETAVDTYT